MVTQRPARSRSSRSRGAARRRTRAASPRRGTDRGEWTGVVKKTKPDGVPKPRGRAPRRDLGLRQGRVGRRPEAVQAQAEDA